MKARQCECHDRRCCDRQTKEWGRVSRCQRPATKAVRIRAAAYGKLGSKAWMCDECATVFASEMQDANRAAGMP